MTWQKNIFQNKCILVVNTGSAKKRFIFKKLKELGLRIIVLNPEKNWASPYVDHWIIAENTRHDEALRAVEFALAGKGFPEPDGVVTFWEDDVILTSKIVDYFQLIGTPQNVAEKARSKFAFREVCRAGGLPTPMFTTVSLNSFTENDIKGFCFPLVLKPIYGSSSAFVVKVHSYEELLQALSYLSESMSVSVESALSDGKNLMVEEYIDGNEVDVDILIQNGKIKFWSISDNDRTNEPFFVEAGQAIPSVLSSLQQEKLLELAETSLELLGIMNGCVHYEAKWSSRGAYPIEANLRMGGDEVYSFVKNCWNVDLVEGAVAIALGKYFGKIERAAEPRKYLRGKYLLPNCSGLLTRLTVPPELKRMPGYEDYNFFKHVGDPVFAPPLGYEYLGWITASGRTASEASTHLIALYESISFEIARFTRASSLGKTERKSPFSAALLQKRKIEAAARIEQVRKVAADGQRNLKIGIASNVFEDSGKANEDELTSDAQHIQKTLEIRGYQVTFLDFNNPFLAVQQIQDQRIDFVFNQCERINGSSLLEPHAAALLDILQVPYTGSNPFTLSLCLDKIRVKKLLTYHNIPTPKWDYFFSLGEEIRQDLRYPLIVKPSNSDSSIGISNDSVVTNLKELKKQLEVIIGDLGRPALVEEYIEGDEYDVSIIGNVEDSLQVLPLSRSVFGRMPQGFWHIYPYEAKFGDRSVYKNHIEVQRPARNVPKRLASLISEIALDTYQILGCQDYGRVEVRVDRDDNPYVLELNPNPSIGEGDCVPSVAKIVGMDYGDFLERIIGLAIRRYKEKPPYYHLQMSIL
jgi:D-alanine-D-alanine ligase